MGGILNQSVETIHEGIHYPCSQRCYNAKTKPNLKGDVLLGQFLDVHNHFKILGQKHLKRDCLAGVPLARLCLRIYQIRSEF